MVAPVTKTFQNLVNEIKSNATNSPKEIFVKKDFSHLIGRTSFFEESYIFIVLNKFNK